METGLLPLCAFSSSRAARLGIDRFVLLLVFIVLTLGVIAFLGRHEGGHTDAGAWGFTLLTLVACVLGAAFGDDLADLLSPWLLGGVAAFVAARPLLAFPLRQRALQRLILEHALK